MEIPKYIQLDFLLVLIGLLITSATSYILFIRNTNTYGFPVFIMFFCIGIMLFMIGFLEMFDNYRSGKRLTMLKNKVEYLKLNEEEKVLLKNRTKII